MDREEDGRGRRNATARTTSPDRRKDTVVPDVLLLEVEARRRVRAGAKLLLSGRRVAVCVGVSWVRAASSETECATFECMLGRSLATLRRAGTEQGGLRGEGGREGDDGG